MGFAQNLLDEIEFENSGQRVFEGNDFSISLNDVEEVEKTLRESIQQELEGNLSPGCAQALINSV